MKYIWIQAFNLIQNNDFWSYIDDKILTLRDFVLKKKKHVFLFLLWLAKHYRITKSLDPKIMDTFEKQYDNYFWSREYDETVVFNMAAE